MLSKIPKIEACAILIGNPLPCQIITGTVSLNEGGRYLASEKRHFTYAEVVSMTNNFQTVIGKGGFGDVYLGIMNEGIQVAVKMLSATSSQGSREFRTEVCTIHLKINVPGTFGKSRMPHATR